MHSLLSGEPSQYPKLTAQIGLCPSFICFRTLNIVNPDATTWEAFTSKSPDGQAIYPRLEHLNENIPPSVFFKASQLIPMFSLGGKPPVYL